MNEPTQLPFPFLCDTGALQRYITTLYTLQAEEEALREQKRLLRQKAKEDGLFPVRAAEAGLKRVLAQRKLEAHPKEPMPRAYQSRIEAMIETHIETLEAEIRDIPTGV